MNGTIVEERDRIETAILLALHARDRGQKMHKTKKLKDRYEADLGMLCPRRPEFPRHAYACDPADAERLFQAGLDGIVVHPYQAIGRSLETMMLCESGEVKWTKLSPMPTPRGIVAVTNRPHRWFAMHYRSIREGHKDAYVKKPVPIDVGGDVLPVKVLGWRGFDQAAERAEAREQIAIALSIFEDAHRVNAFQATVEEDVRLTFPVGQDAYKDFLLLRDGHRNTPTGRKNPILHWCSKHFRQKPSGGISPVTKHLKGAEEIVVGPMRLTIQPTEGYSAFMAMNEKSPAHR